MKTEKVSVNLNPVELGQIDYLVSRGLFDSRSDFIRTASRKSLEGYKDEFDKFLREDEEVDSSDKMLFGVAYVHIVKSELTRLHANGRKLHIRVIGVLSFDKAITPEDIRNTISYCKVGGKLIAKPEIKAALEEIAYL